MHLWEDRFDVITDDVKIKSRKPEAKPVAGGMASVEAGHAFLLTSLLWRPGISSHMHTLCGRACHLHVSVRATCIHVYVQICTLLHRHIHPCPVYTYECLNVCEHVWRPTALL